MAKATNKPQPEEDLFFPPGAPPPYITTQQGRSVNDSDTVISFPEVVVNNPSDPEAPGAAAVMKNFDFTDKQIRSGFIRKVYMIIMTQIAITSAVVAWFMYDARMIRAIQDNMGVFLGVTLTTYLTTALMLICCEGPRRRVPYNFIFLLLLTLSLSALVGVACSFCDVKVVLTAGGITFAIVLSLTIFAFQTKIDFTVMSGSILCLCLVLFFFGIAAAFSPYPALQQFYCALGVLIMSIFLVYDTQLIIGGEHRYAISPEEYVFAALALYLDIMYIFIRVLRLLR